MAYAATTNIDIGTTKADIEKMMLKAGASAFGIVQDGPKAQVIFRLKERMYRFAIIIPDLPQPARARWRALLLVLKAKIEAVDSGITSLEDEFLAQTMMSDGETVGQKINPQIEENYRIGGTPQLLLSGDQ